MQSATADAPCMPSSNLVHFYSQLLGDTQLACSELASLVSARGPNRKAPRATRCLDLFGTLSIEMGARAA